MSKLIKKMAGNVYELVQSRVFIIFVLFLILSFILLQRLFVLQIVNGQEYFDDYKLQIQKTKEVQGTRGNIYDRNGKLLAYNKLAYSVVIEDNGEYDDLTEKNKILNDTITRVIDIVEANGDTVINSFGIILDKNNEYKYVAENETTKLRFIADVFGFQTIDELSEEQSNMSAADIINYLCTDETYGYDLDQSALSKEYILKLVNIRYAISLNSYQKYITTTIAEDVCNETVAIIEENLDTLQGVSVEETSIRRYNNANCFSNIIGYTGKISQEEYDALSSEDQEKYSLTDTVGKSGIEQTMDSYLQGTKGEVKLYVNSVGKVIETVNETPSSAGNDLYLTIDSDLQEAAYKILEQQLAGIVLSKMTTSLSFDRTKVSDGSNVKIPIGDVYYSFIDNDIIDITHFDNEEAGDVEKELSKTFASSKKKILSSLKKYFSNPDGDSYKKLSTENQAYVNYIVATMLTENDNIINSDVINLEDDTYIAWNDSESINVYTYLTYAISQNWLNTSKLTKYLQTKEKYSNSTETYSALIEYVLDALEDDNTFDKLIYKYKIKDGTISGRQICMILYEQDVLESDKSTYNSLKSGATTGYDFIRSKLSNLEITPGDIALEPCTGSMVLTDQDTGEILACVSYPGYDNNRLANTMDSDYYSMLISDNARPFYNNATQEKTAPGSTYKPLTSICALTEGIIDEGTYYSCSGEFKKVTPSPQCWIYPSGHGSQNVVSGIKNSCNCFFYEVGWQLGQVEETNSDGDTESIYHSEVGLEKLEKYAEEFGLGETTGIEIPESEPEISDDSAILSAIGQGTNNYTTIQLARYITAVANEGTVYNFSLISKITDVDGNVIKEYSPSIKNQITDVEDSTWELVKEGMSQVVTSSYATVFSKLTYSGLEIYGKTGTAQQSAYHPDHALFVGFTNDTDNDVAFAVRIANGYGSTFAANVGRNVLSYYYNIEDKKEIITGQATSVSTTTTTNDD